MKWQQVAKSGTKKDNEWRWMTTSNKNDSELQRMTDSDKTNEKTSGQVRQIDFKFQNETKYQSCS